MRLILILNTALTLLTCVSFAQQQKKETSDVKIGDFVGEESYSITTGDTLSLKNGNYIFTSDLLKQVSHGSIILKGLKLGGEYLDNKKQGNWKYEFCKYSLEDVSISHSRSVSLQHELTGVEDVFSINYQDGHFQGSSHWNRKTLKKGKYGEMGHIATLNYNKDTLINEFSFNTEDVEIKGRLDSLGFLDGELQLKYIDRGLEILETRTYNDGFLIEIEKLHNIENGEVVRIRFDDVAEQLELLSDTTESLDLKVSDGYFGSKFNFGYRQNDPRITEQVNGNRVLEKHLLLLDSIHNIHGNENNHKIVLKLTRRFQFIYDDKDELLSKSLLTDVNKTKHKIDSFLRKPNVLLRKNHSDTIYQRYEILNHIVSKLDILDDNLRKINSDYFDFRFRDKYYENGIPGLNENDSVPIVLRDQEFKVPFHIKSKVPEPESLITDMVSYNESLKELSDSLTNSILKSLTIYNNQDRIDSLDRVISINDTRISELYRQKPELENEELSKIPYSYKAFFSINERILSKQYNKYINNSLPQDEMISLGIDVICTQSFLIENQTLLNKIGSMQKNWNDSLFTVYRDNPFDFRKLETKILERIQNSADILLTQYANQLLNAKSCEQLGIELQKIIRLNERVKYLVKNQALEKVQRLNKALRREQVPNRIERILEL